jgi:hypothetical protein
MTKIQRLFRFLAAPLALVFALSACSPKVNSGSSQNSSSEQSSYYNANNFIPSSKTINENKLVTYDGPSLLKTSPIVGVKANGRDLFVYETLVNHSRVFSWNAPDTVTQAAVFDFEGKVHIDIEIKSGIVVTSAIVRPLVYGYEPKIENNVISFDLEQTGNFVVEYNGDETTAIQLFANPIEENPLTAEEAAKDSNTIYVGPGIYNAGAFPISDGTTIYLAGGAYVYGQFSAEGVSDVTIRGRGIVSGSIYSRASESDYTIPVVMRKVNNLKIEGVCFFDPAGWALHLWKCTNVLIDNVKIITARSNGDGISIQSCSNVEVSGGYVRTWDDSLVVKNVDEGSTSNINIHDVVVWTDLAQSMEVGYETYGPTMDEITFENITILHNFHKAVISMHNSDEAKITNVTYKNITLEDGQMLGDDKTDGENDFLIDFTIAYNGDWSKSTTRGSIDGVKIENVKVYSMANSIVARMQGEDDNSSIKNVTIKGLQINGRQILSKEDLGLTTNDYVSNVKFEEMDKVLGAYITLPYSLSSSIGENVNETDVPTISQEGLLVPSFARYSGELPFIGVKAAITGTAVSSHGAGSKSTTPADDGSGLFLFNGSSAENAFDGDASTLYETGTWTGETSEFAALTYTFGAYATIGVLRLKGDPNNDYSYSFHIQVWSRRYKTDGTMNDKYTRLLTEKEYEMSPSNGNCIDINLPAQEFAGIQLRFDRGNSIASPAHYAISEIEFYPPSLTFSKAIVDSTDNYDVYPVSKLVDGDPTGTSYYESAELPAHVVIDLGNVYDLSVIVLSLPPSIVWSARTESIMISTSDSNLSYDKNTTSFVVTKERANYLFDPTTGNQNVIQLDSVPCRYLRLDIYSNDAAGGYGAQLSEVSAYGSN